MKNEKKTSELVSTIKMRELTLVDTMIFQEVLARFDTIFPHLPPHFPSRSLRSVLPILGEDSSKELRAYL